MPATDANTCNFPGCTRPVPRGSAPGRPPEYCDLPEHTRWRAWRERQRLREETAEQAAAQTAHEGAPATAGAGPVLTGGASPASGAGGATPVTSARLRADDLLVRFSVQAEQLTATLAAATDAFAAMTDPANVEAQVEAVRVDAARRIAEADAARLEADGRRRAA
ncbi:hypothetical protein ACFPZ0_27505, partial [Streptomonospora nanhaiensis]